MTWHASIKLSSFFWVWLADRHGERPLICFTFTMVARQIDPSRMGVGGHRVHRRERLSQATVVVRGLKSAPGLRVMMRSISLPIVVICRNGDGSGVPSKARRNGCRSQFGGKLLNVGRVHRPHVCPPSRCSRRRHAASRAVLRLCDLTGRRTLRGLLNTATSASL
jgi:hypothetical protein